jgi:hypothetical protein
VKQGTGISASLGAIAGSLASMACCLPFGFAAALGVAGASSMAQRFRPWLLGLSVALWGVGLWQQRRAGECSKKRKTVSAVLLWAAAGIVAGVILFPQEIAAFIADRLFGAGK